MARAWALTSIFLLGLGFLGAEPLTGTHWIVPKQAWYRIDATGDGDASLTIVDKSAGTVGSVSLRQDAGSWSGRTGLLLEAGDYQLRWNKAGAVKASAEAVSFALTNAATTTEAPTLSDRQSLRSTLSDRQSVAYWVTVPEGNNRLSLTIRGRSLGKVVLWREGIWDVGLEFQSYERQPVANRTYRYYELDRDVPAGRYLLWVFGGPKAVWGDNSNEEPLAISRGGELLVEGAVREGTLDAEGRAEWLVGPTVSQLQLEALTPGSFVLAAGDRRFQASYQNGLSEKEPIRLVSLGINAGARWSVVQGPVGARYRLRALPSETSEVTTISTTKQGALITASASAQAGDGYPSTAVILSLARSASVNNPPTLIWEQTLSLGPNAPLHLGTNNKAASSILIRVTAKGSYAVVENGQAQGTAQYQFDLVDDLLRGNRSSAMTIKGNGSVELQEKLYRVTSTAVKPGRTDWALVPAGLGQGLAAAGLWGKANSATREAWTTFVAAPPNDRYLQWWIPGREGVPRAVSIQPLPLLAARLPALALEAGKPLNLPIEFSGGIVGGWSTGPTVSVDRVSLSPATEVAAGIKAVSLSLPRAGVFEWRADPKGVDPAPDSPRSIPSGAALWEDWGQQQTRVFDLTVAESGLYRLQTLGRLSLGVQVRTPLRPRLFDAQMNAGGTNARVDAYLNPGIYRVQVTSLGGTAGRAGLTLVRDNAPVVRTLVPGTQARATVAADRLLRVDVVISKSAPYLLTSTGLRQDFIRRFEDPEGYPVDSALGSGGGSWTLSAGTYRLFSYPLPSASRRSYGLVDLSPWTKEQTAEKAFDWNKTVQATWKETPDRQPMTFALKAQAPLLAQLSLDEGMVYDVLGPDGASLGRGPGGKPVELSLPQGNLQVLIRSRAVDNQKDFSLRLATRDLTPGRSIVFDPATPVPVAVGQTGTYELSLWGRSELPLYLYDAEGKKLLAKGEPRTDDWNPVVTIKLTPGRYLAAFAPLASRQTVPEPEVFEDPPSGEDSRSFDEGDGDGDGEEYGEGEGDGEGGGDGGEYEGESSGEMDAEDLPREIPVAPWTAWTEARYPGDQGGASLLTLVAREVVDGSTITGAGGSTEVWGSTLQTRSFVTAEAGPYRFASDAGRLVTFRLERDGRTLAQIPGGFTIPLLAKTTYKLTAWWEDGTERPVTWSAGPASGVQVWKNPNRTSGRLVDPRGTVLGSPGWEVPLTPVVDGWLNPLETTGWWALDNGLPLETAQAETPKLSAGGRLSIPVGEGGQTVGLETPAGSVGLLRARGSGLDVGVSVGVGPVPLDWNWNQARISTLSTLVGVSAGNATARLWSPAPTTDPRWVDVTFEAFPTQDLPAGALEGTVAPGKAVVLKSTSKSLRFLLDQGLVAFSLTGAGSRPLSADDEPTSGLLSGTSYAVLNTATTPRPWRALPSAEAPPVAVNEGNGFEAVFDEPRDLVLEVQAVAGSRLFVKTQSAQSLRWGDGASGHWALGEETAGPAGSRVEFSTAKGTLFLKGVQGFVKVWVATAAKADQAGLGLEGGPKGAVAPEGVLLPPGAQSWTFTPPLAGFYSVEADGPGVLAVLAKDGKPLASSWDAASRSLLVRLGTEAVTVGARPFSGRSQAGALRVVALAPQTGGPRLLGPGERQLWPVLVTSSGRIGLAVEAPLEGLTLRLFGPDYLPLGTGALFWRTLSPGTYWLVVQGTSTTVRYRPILLGLEGSRIGVPDDILATYTQGNAP